MVRYFAIQNNRRAQIIVKGKSLIFKGYFDKRKKPKPSKPNKEEGNESASEEVGEEEETSSESTGGGEGVAISPPPEGSSVAEAKPVGLAIAGT